MAHRLPPFCLVLAVVCGATTAQDGYEVTFTRDANEFTLKCSDINNGVPLGNPEWYFNASHYKNHSCTEDAVKVGTDLTVNLTPECEGFFQCGDGILLSVPRLLLTCPTLISGKDDRFINATIGEQLTIPCGIRVSATGNLKIEWLECFLFKNPPCDSASGMVTPEYDLKIESIPSRDSTYTCVATATDSQSCEKTLAGPSNEVTVKEYSVLMTWDKRITCQGMPEIQDISMSAANEEVRFTVSAVGTPSNKYTWIRNGDVLDNSDDGVQINPSPPVLRLDSVHSGDIITVEASNTNIHGETSSDRVLVFVFTLASSSEPGGIITPSSAAAVAASANCHPFSTNKISGILNILFILVIVLVVIVIIVLFVCVTLFTAAKKNNPLPPSPSSTESSILSVGSYSIDKQKMTDCNVNEFFRKLDIIIGLFVDEIGEKNLHEGVVDEVTELRKLILGWEVKRDRTQIDQSQQKTVDETKLDGSPVSYEMIPDLESPPTGDFGYYAEADDMVSILLPSLNRIKRQES